MNSRFTVVSALLSISAVAACDGRYVLADLQSIHDEPGGGSAGGGSAGDGFGGGGTGGDLTTGGSGSAGRYGIGITPSSVPDARLGNPYAAELGATGGVAPYTFELVAGNLARGLSLGGEGLLSGTPEEVGEFAFVVRVRDADGTQGQAPFQLRVGRSRWLAVHTFPSSASSQTLLSLVDLSDPEGELIRLESASAHDSTFSPDGRWLLYYGYVSVTERQQYLVDTSVDLLQPEPLLTTGLHPCRWAPDSSKLACVESAGTEQEPALELVYLDMTLDRPGLRVPIGPAQGPCAFLDPDTLVYVDGNDEFARVTWSGTTAAEPVPLGIEAGPITMVAPDGRRGLVVLEPAMQGQPAVMALVDFSSGQWQVLPEHDTFSLDEGFEAAAGYDPAPSGLGFGSYSYYAVRGVEASLVLRADAEDSPSFTPVYALAGSVVVREKNGAVAVVDVSEASPVERIVPGEYDGVSAFELDARGEWLSFVTAELDEDQQRVSETAKFWLSRLEAGQPSPPALIGGGFLPGSQKFSPNGKRLALHGYDSQATMPVEFRLYDLENPEAIAAHDLALPFNWSNPVWSPDSSFVHFIGGAPLTSSRPMLLIDALAPATAPRLIVECDSNPAPLPGCPNYGVFQP